MAVGYEIFGHFDSAEQNVAAYDPGLSVPCPFCLKLLDRPLRTTSLMADGDTRSFFYRAHRACAEKATPAQVEEIESSLIDARTLRATTSEAP